MFKNERCEKCTKECAICKFFTEKERHTVNGEIYVFNEMVNCKSSKIVYGILCEKCQKIIYIGETGTTVYERFQNHISCIKRQIDHPVAEHFNSENHDILHMKIVCIEKIRKIDIHFRKIRESFWINKLQTLYPKGINKNVGIGDGIRGSKFQ